MYKHCAEFGNDPKALAQDADLMIMGVTPSGSGRLHDGHHLTIYNFLRTVCSNSTTRGLIHVDDREFCCQFDPILVSEKLTQNTENLILNCIHTASAYFHDSSLLRRVSVQRMSDMFTNRNDKIGVFGNRLLDLIKINRNDISVAFNEMGLHGIGGIRPHCPECNMGFIRKPRWNRFAEDGIRGRCHNPKCSTEGFTVQVIHDDTRWSLFYGLVSLMSVPLSESINNGSVLECLGGDYGMPWGKPNKHMSGRLLSKGERASIMTERMTRNTGLINHYVGPLLQSKGKKLAKSKGDASVAMDCDRMQQYLETGESIIDVRLTTA